MALNQNKTRKRKKTRLNNLVSLNVCFVSLSFAFLTFTLLSFTKLSLIITLLSSGVVIGWAGWAAAHPIIWKYKAKLRKK